MLRLDCQYMETLKAWIFKKKVLNPKRRLVIVLAETLIPEVIDAVWNGICPYCGRPMCRSSLRTHLLRGNGKNKCRIAFIEDLKYVIRVTKAVTPNIYRCWGKIILKLPNGEELKFHSRQEMYDYLLDHPEVVELFEKEAQVF